MNQIRLLPLVIGAVAALLVLKTVALSLDEGRLTGVATALAEGADAAEPAPEPIADQDQSRSREALLESLSERRKALDEREKELDLREKLLEATRARIEERVVELREIESRIETAMAARDQERAERFAGLVTMYEAMKPRDAADIFDRLDMSTLVRVAEEMNPRNMSEILAAMDPDVAQRLTLELSADKPGSRGVDEGDNLPKITGTPDG